MIHNDDPWQAKKALLILGGAVVTGIILSQLGETEGTAAESSNVDKNKSKTNTGKKIPKGKIYQVLVPDKSKSRKKDPVEVTHSASTNEERKYPDFYYHLSKGQQYKFRLKQRDQNE